MTERNKIRVRPRRDKFADSDVRPSAELAAIHGTSTPRFGGSSRRIVKMGALILVILLFALTIAPRDATAPEWRTLPPNTVTVTTGTGTGTVDDLFADDALVYSVLEEDVGTSSLHTATESWIVQGTLESGTFPDDMETHDDTGVVYQEVDDDNGALTGDSVLLTPTGAGTYTEWDAQSPGPGAHWDKVDDDPPHDDNTTYISTNAINDDDTYATEDLVFSPGTKQAGTLTVFNWCHLLFGGVSGEIKENVYTGGTLYLGDADSCTVAGGYLNYSYQWATNPATGNEWTRAEIDAMEIGTTYIDGSADAVSVTSVGAVVPTQDLNYVLDVRHNVTAVPAGREFYVLTMRAHTDFVETFTVSVYDHVAPGWDAMFVFDCAGYETERFTLTEADHVNAGEVWVRVTDSVGDAAAADSFDIDLLRVQAYNVEYALSVSFNWVGLDSHYDPRLSVVGYKSDAETFTLQVLRTGAWWTLDADILQNGIMSSWSFDLAPADVWGGGLQVRFVDNDVTDNDATTIYLDLLTVRVEMRDEAPRAPIDVYVDVSYDLWANEIILWVHWTQSGGPEPALETGKWATIWTDDVELGIYTVGDGARRVPAPWSYLDGNDHNITAVGAVHVIWTTWGGNQTYYSDPDLETISNFPRMAVLMFGLFCLLAVVAIVAVRAIKERKREAESGPR